MDTLLFILGLCYMRVAMGQEDASSVTNSTKDMYVIHATVYQLGIITNKSDEEVANTSGNQEALTFYHTNGSTMDLSAIPAPWMTNVTAQSVMGLAPVGDPATTGDSLLAQLTSANNVKAVQGSENSENTQEESAPSSDMPIARRSLNASQTDVNSQSIKVVKETALIPLAAGLQSIGLPSLLGLNTSLTPVPVPIPNTSIVRYAKVNTVVQTP